MHRTNIKHLTDIPNIGSAVSRRLQQIGINIPNELIGKDPYQMYHQLCDISGKRHDHCIIDVFISAIRYMEGAPAQKWWAYTAERKSVIAKKAKEK